MHVAWLMGVTQSWPPTRTNGMALWSSPEKGAQAMVDDGLVKRFPKPDIALGQHVMSLPAGQTRLRSGVSRSDSLKVTLFGRGGYGSAPETNCP
jgi:metal-dependent amidase/aminoacylase/carboxypeptidase family protein